MADSQSTYRKVAAATAAVVFSALLESADAFAAPQGLPTRVGRAPALAISPNMAAAPPSALTDKK